MVKLTDSDLIKALYLIKNLRANSVINHIDPRATRIALKFAMLIDDYLAKTKLTPKEDAELDQIAQDLFNKEMRSKKEEDNNKPIQELETIIWIPMLKSLLKTEGKCPCYPEESSCPCKEFIENYQCRCGLFIIKKVHRY